MTIKNAIYLVHLGTFLAVCLWDITNCQGSGGDNGWFGTNCTYKCHCNKTCASNGTCIDHSNCMSGWFGPECQYLDLLQTNSSQETPTWLNDNDATTCNTDQSSQSLTITLQDVFFVTWLRLHVNTSGISRNYTVHFNTTINGQLTHCANMTILHVTDTVSDIHCDQGVLFQQLILTGDGVPFLCSLYISGGRNVALKQNTNQTSTLNLSPSPTSDKAVDGSTNSNIDNNVDSNSCTHTNNTTLPQRWILEFKKPQQVNRYVIFNRDKFQERLNRFVLKADTTNGTPVFHYNATKTNQSTYDFWSDSLTGVSQVTISVDNFLTLCEVEMFGDAICEMGNYGRECERKCNCATKGDKCYVSTGGCPTGCAAGYHWEDCQQPCSETFFGIDCAQKCSVNCTGKLCDAKNGTCHSCVVGTKGPKCESECDPKRYGLNCTEKCSTNCDGELCNAENGICHSCVAGKMGEMCNQSCNETHYGKNCASACNSNCKNHTCNAVNGTCDSCVRGKQGPMCESDCDQKLYGENCKDVCDLNCTNQICNSTTGICFSCVAGKTGEHCDQDCSATHYGENCSQTCPTNCNNGVCNPVHGTCQSCVLGKQGPVCESDCNATYFGENCAQKCSSNCQDQLCHSITSKCFSCVSGNSGELCDQVPEDNTPVGVIVGPIVAVVVLSAVIVVLMIVWRRRRNGKAVAENRTETNFGFDLDVRQNGSDVTSTTSDKPLNNVPTKEKPPIKAKPQTFSSLKDSKGKAPDAPYYNSVPGRSDTTISAGDFNHFMTSHIQDFFQKQFVSIPANSSATTTAAMNPDNLSKNRYKNVNAYDHSRVHLTTDSKMKHGDYINASYINGFTKQQKFIASQGPTKTILEDFVRMLWEQGVEVVVMLTNLIEEGKLKCEQYWPNDDQIDIGEITIKLTTTQVFADYTIRRLKLYKGSKIGQILTHFHFTTWPDKDVPTTAWGLVELNQRMSEITTDKPIVIHCSAGVGRTGTFIALHNILEEIEETGHMDFFTTVQKLRHDRINMVQTSGQYVFLHKATQIALVCKDTTVTSSNIRDRIHALEQISKSGQTNMDQEFKSFCLVCDAEDQGHNADVEGENTYYNSQILSNKMKNRLHNVLPKDLYRPQLTCYTKGMESYINAVFVPSFKKHDQQFLTQLPLPTTITDFWRLVTQYNVGLVVAFEMNLKNEDTTIGDYLLQGNDLKDDSFFNIKIASMESGKNWDIQRVAITVDLENRSRMTNTVPFEGEYNLSHIACRHTDFTPESLLEFVKKVRSMIPVGERRILYMCRNGAEFSGLVCTMSLLLDRMDNDQHVSVPLVLGSVKAIRPQVVATLNQYRLLYQALNLFAETNSVYSNFGNTRSTESSPSVSSKPVYNNINSNNDD